MFLVHWRIPKVAINRVTCPLRYNPPQEFCTYEVNEKPGGGEEAGITYPINENVSEKLNGKKGHYDTYGNFCSQRCCLAFFIEKKGYDSKFKISYFLMKARYSGPAAPHWTKLKDFEGNMSQKAFKDNSTGRGKQQKCFKSEPSMNWLTRQLKIFYDILRVWHTMPPL